MNLATYKLVMAIGVLLNSALYLVGCFVAGLMLANSAAWLLTLAAMGVTYLSYLCHFVASPHGRSNPAAPLVWLSMALGAASGAALLLG